MALANNFQKCGTAGLLGPESKVAVIWWILLELNLHECLNVRNYEYMILVFPLNEEYVLMNNQMFLLICKLKNCEVLEQS